MFNKKATRSSIVGVTAVIVLLALTAISIPTTEVFAGKYKDNQAASQANACGNGEIPTNVGCLNVDSQIQGDENGVAITGQQTFPQVRPISDGNGPNGNGPNGNGPNGNGPNGNGPNGNGPTNVCPAGSVLVTDLALTDTVTDSTVGPVTICIVINGETPLVSLLGGLIVVDIVSTESTNGCTAPAVEVAAEVDGTTVDLCVQLNVVVDASLELPPVPGA